jgi:hypothetical protein
MTYASSSRKCSVCSDWSHNMNARDYLRFSLAKCKQKPTTLTPLRKFWPNLQELCLKILLQKQSDKKYGCNMVFSWCMRCTANFNNISAMSWQFVLLVEEIGVPGENHRPVTSNWQTLSHNVVHVVCTSPWKGFQLTTLVVIGTDCTDSCKSNYHTFMTTTDLAVIEMVVIDNGVYRQWLLLTMGCIDNGCLWL